MANFIVVFKKLIQPSIFSNHHPDQSEAINIETRPSTRKNTMTIEGTHDGYQFLAIVFLGMYIVLDIMLLLIQ